MPISRILTAFLCLLNSIQLSSQSYTSYFTGNPDDLKTKPLGGSCLMGGASENDNAMMWFLNRANGGDVLVLRASGSDGYNDYMYTDLGVELNSVESIVFHNASAADETYIQNKIKNAEAIWFAGGNQWNYVKYWRNTAIDSLINIAVNERNIVIGGTSAGMAIASQYYFSAENGSITSSVALNNPYDEKVAIGKDSFLKLGYLNNVITDTHYDARNRSGRQTTFLARLLMDEGIYPKGIAAEEYTAICIDESGIARVFGKSAKQDYAYFIRPNCDLPSFAPESCDPGKKLIWDLNAQALVVYKVKGTENAAHSIDLNDWTSGEGGTWEFWSVKNGQLYTFPASQPACSGKISSE